MTEQEIIEEGIILDLPTILELPIYWEKVPTKQELEMFEKFTIGYVKWKFNEKLVDYRYTVSIRPTLGCSSGYIILNTCFLELKN